MSNPVRLRPSRTMFPWMREVEVLGKLKKKQAWVQLVCRNILLDLLAHQVGPEGAESERTPLPPL